MKNSHQDRTVNRRRCFEAISYSQKALLSTIVGLFVALMTGFLAAPDIGWLDTGELISASFELGIAHPPGHPLPAVFGKLCSFFPFGTVAFRVNLASSLALGLASGVGTFLFIEILEEVVGKWFPSLSKRNMAVAIVPVSVAGVCVFSVTGSALMQGVRAEVYAMNLALCLGGFLGIFRWWKEGRAGPLWAGGLSFGLALSNHHVLALAVFIPGFFLLSLGAWTKKSKRGGRDLLLCFGAIALGLSVLAYLPLRAQTDPLVNWGHPDTLARFFWTFSAKIFSKTATKSVHSGVGVRTLLLVGQIVGDLGWAPFLLSILGIYLLFRTRETHFLGVVLILALVTTTGACLLVDFKPENPDSRGYMMMVLLLISFLGCVPVALGGAVILTKRKNKNQGRWGVLLVSSGLLAFVLPTFDRGLQESLQLTSWGRFELNEHIFRTLPPETVFLMGYHETVFGVWYGQVVCGKRPDVMALYRHNVDLPGRANQMSRRWPHLSALIDGLEEKGNADNEILRMASARPVYVEPDNSPSDPLGKTALKRLSPRGLWAVVEPESQPLNKKADQEAWRKVMEVSSPFMGETGFARYLLWRSFGATWLLVHQGRCDLSAQAVHVARWLAPKDPLLRTLLRRCGDTKDRNPLE